MEANLDMAYKALLKTDRMSLFERRTVGPVDECVFTVTEDSHAHIDNYIVDVPKGVYVMVRNATTWDWITINKEEDN